MHGYYTFSYIGYLQNCHSILISILQSISSRTISQIINRDYPRDNESCILIIVVGISTYSRIIGIETDSGKWILSCIKVIGR